MVSASFSAIPANLESIRSFVEYAANNFHVPETIVYNVVWAVDEAATNIILHGYAGKDGILEVEVDRQGNTLLVRLKDQAPQFDPTSIPLPDLTLGLERRPPGGLGMYIIRKLMDQVLYRSPDQGGNELTLVKILPFLEGSL